MYCYNCGTELEVGIGVGGYFLYKNISSSKSNTTASKEKDKENEKKKSDKKKEEEKKADAKEEKDADKQDDLKDSVEGAPPKKEESVVKKEKEAPAAPVYEYQVIAQRMTWSEAYTYCQSQGGQLATPSTQEEYNQIVQKANESGLKVLWLGGTANTRRIWIYVDFRRRIFLCSVGSGRA